MAGFGSGLVAKRTLGLRKETAAGVAETLSRWDYNLAAEAISYTPDIAMAKRVIATGDFSKTQSIAGKMKFTCKFKVALTRGQNGAVANWMGALQCCGLKLSGTILTTDAGYTNVPATIEIQEWGEGSAPDAVVIKAKGCMGTAKISFNSVGEPAYIEFDFTGALVSITDRANASVASVSMSIVDSVLPDAVLAASLTLFAENQKASKVTIDLGNKVELYQNPSDLTGYDYAHIVDREVKIELDPDLDSIANRGDMARWTGNSLGSFLLKIGPYLTISAASCQYEKAYQPGEREGHVVNQKTLFCKRGPAGNDELAIIQI